MARDEPHQAALRAAAQATRARIRRDRAQAPASLKKVFTVVGKRLFSSNLNAGEAFRDAGIKDCAVRAVFKQATGTRLSRYIAAARIEVADVLMMTTDLQLTTISVLVGYTYHPTFTDNYKREKGKPPSQVERTSLTRPLIDDETSLKAGRGLLEPDAMVAYMEDLMRICPEAAERFREKLCNDDPGQRIVVDGARSDELKAAGVWQQISALPFEEQCHQVRRYQFHSTVFFDLLRDMSRIEGRKSRQRGIEVAELALVSLDNSDPVFGERIHDLRALGWAWLGNAHRLALDFTASSAAFEQAAREWSVPRTQHDLSVLASICGRRGALHTWRREYVQATKDLDRACSLFRQREDRAGQIRALLQRAAIHGYAGRFSDSLQDLKEASRLIDKDEDPKMAFDVRTDLAITRIRAGETERAAEELERARQIDCVFNDPVGATKIDWIAGDLAELQGDLESAKRLYQNVRAGIRDAGEPRYLGMISVDLMTIHSQQGDLESVAALAAETLPILGSMHLHTETIAAVGLLADAVNAQQLSRHLLSDLRVTLRQDPLTM